MLMADTVMDADEPRFQIGEDEMDDRQIVLGNLWVAALGNGKVFIPALAEAGISTPIVSDGQRPRSNGALHEPTKRVGAPIGYYGEPDTPGIASVLSLVLRGSRFPMTNLDGTSDENLVVDTPAFAASPSTNPCLVYLNMFPRLAADTILIGPHHASAELVENAEGRLIARQAKLSLKLNRRDAGRLAGDQISRPKPCAQRHMAAFHDGANRQARIVAALATAQDTGTSGDAEGIACGMAMRTDEAVAPSSFFHVGSTLRFIGKKLLKLWKRPRKGQVVTLKDVHGSLSIIHTKSIPSGCVRQADRQAWKLCTNMTADDVTATLKLALEASGCNRANVVHKPRLLSDNGSSYISGDLAEWLEDHGMDHVRGAPYHPQTQGKIEHWHQTLKNRILLENYYLPGDLENQISAFVDHYNNQRYHESIGNVTPADAYFGRHTAIIEKRKRIKKLTTQNRRLNHQRQAA